MSLYVEEDLHVDRNGDFGGDLTVDGQLSVGSARIANDLTVSGALTADSSSITNDQVVKGDLNVEGATVVDGLTTGNTTVKGKLNVDDEVTSGYGPFVDCSNSTSPSPPCPSE
jgi:cytoskeletal protein CcmA (bactofilin family)